MGTTRSRAAKVAWLESTIVSYFEKNPQGVISHSKLLANFALENNSTERTGKEILALLAKVRKFKINGDNIVRK
jgi:hypothetical protein